MEPNRYELERIDGVPEWAHRLQDNVARALTGISADTDSGTAASAAAATGAGTVYTPVDATDWAGTAPTTVGAALDRLAQHVKTGAGAVPIVELP